MYTVFKEYSEKDSLTYPTNQVITLIQNSIDSIVFNRLYHFLDENGHKHNLESAFQKIFFNNYNSEFCSNHQCDNMIVKNSISFLIHKYVKDIKKASTTNFGPLRKN